jgi:hypothetical protein
MLARDADIGGWNNPTLIYFIIFSFTTFLVVWKLSTTTSGGIKKLLVNAIKYLKFKVGHRLKRSPERSRKGSDPEQFVSEIQGLKRFHVTKSMPDLAKGWA